MRKAWIAPLSVGLMVVLSALTYSRLPEQIPSHWNIQGQVDGTMPRLIGVIIFPIVGVVVLAIMWIVGNIDPRKANYAGFKPARQLIINVFALFMLLVHGVVLGTALGWQIEVPQLIMIGIGLLFMFIGNEMGRIKPNWFWGIRTPWTLADDRVWRKTHRIGGRWFFGVGLLTVATAFIKPPFNVFISIGAILIVALYTVFYSYREWRQLQSN